MGTVTGGAFAFALALPIALVVAGEALIAWLGVPLRTASVAPVALITGTMVIATLLLIADNVLPWGLRATSVIVVAATVLARASAPRISLRDGGGPANKLHWQPLAAVVLALLAATSWTRGTRPYKTTADDVVTFSPWIDVFVHAQFVGQLRNDAAGQGKLGNPDLAGLPLPIYHYASYTLPASFEAWGGSVTTALDAIIAIWIPLGATLVALAAYALATEWFNESAGLAALCAASIAPDSPAYAIPLDWYSYHWLMQVAPASYYGVAIAAVAIILIGAGTAESRRALVATGLGIVAIDVLFKAQIAIVAFPAAIAWAITFDRQFTSRQRWYALGVVVAGGVATSLIMDRLGIGPNLVPNGSWRALPEYLRDRALETRPGLWRSAFGHVFRMTSPGRAPFVLASLIAVFTIAPFGALLIVLPTLLVAFRRRRILVAADAWPVAVLAATLAIAAIVPANCRGAADELWHRPFVWAYFVLVSWCAARLFTLVPDRWQLRASLRLSSLTLVAVLLGYSFFRGLGIQHESALGAVFSDTRLPRGFVDCAEWLRDHSQASEYVQDMTRSEFPFLSSLSERRTYLGRWPKFWSDMFSNTSTSTEATRRGRVLDQLNDASGEFGVQNAVSHTSVDWFVAAPGESEGWPPARVAYSSRGYRVFDLRGFSSGQFNTRE